MFNPFQEDSDGDGHGDMCDECSFRLVEFPIYGLGRVGVAMPDINIDTDVPPTTTFTRRLNRKFYELTDHLGNVRAVLGDRKRTGSPGTGPYFGEIRSYSHVYPFGMPQPGRVWDSLSDYRYGYNGMETDPEVKEGGGKHYTTYFRQYDPRLGRWWSHDPVTHSWESPYAAMFNNPIYFSDVLGATGEGSGGETSPLDPASPSRSNGCPDCPLPASEGDEWWTWNGSQWQRGIYMDGAWRAFASSSLVLTPSGGSSRDERPSWLGGFGFTPSSGGSGSGTVSDPYDRQPYTPQQYAADIGSIGGVIMGPDPGSPTEYPNSWGILSAMSVDEPQDYSGQLFIIILQVAPVTSDIIDIVNAARSAARGEWLDAAGNLVFLLPYSDLAKAPRLLKHVDDVKEGKHVIYGVMDATGNFQRKTPQEILEETEQFIARRKSETIHFFEASASNFTLQGGRVLTNGMSIKISDALDLAEEFLGNGYKSLGNGRFVSADGSRVVRMGDNDILGRHAGGPHMNFETLVPNPSKPGKLMIDKNLHIFLED